MLTENLAIVSETNRISAAGLNKVAAALQKQLSRDFVKPWKIRATINAYQPANKLPAEYWRIEIRDDIGKDGHGLHFLEGKGKRKDREPVAYVTASDDLTQVSRTCSHEMLEMLINPDGIRLSKRRVPPADTNLPPELRANTRVKYLMEITDPCQAGRDSYTIDGVTVSDFCLPNYYDGPAGPAFYHNNGDALEVRPGGYVTFCNEAEDTWWKTDMFGGRLRTKSINTPEAFQRRLKTTHSRPSRGARAGKPKIFKRKADMAVPIPGSKKRRPRG